MYFMQCYYGRCIHVMGVYMYNCMFHVEQTSGGVGSYYSYNWLWKCGTFTGTVCMHACSCVCMCVYKQRPFTHLATDIHIVHCGCVCMASVCTCVSSCEKCLYIPTCANPHLSSFFLPLSFGCMASVCTCVSSCEKFLYSTFQHLLIPTSL